MPTGNAVQPEIPDDLTLDQQSRGPFGATSHMQPYNAAVLAK